MLQSTFYKRATEATRTSPSYPGIPTSSSIVSDGLNGGGRARQVRDRPASHTLQHGNPALAYDGQGCSTSSPGAENSTSSFDISSAVNRGEANTGLHHWASSFADDLGSSAGCRDANHRQLLGKCETCQNWKQTPYISDKREIETLRQSLRPAHTIVTTQPVRNEAGTGIGDQGVDPNWTAHQVCHSHSLNGTLCCVAYHAESVSI